VEVALVLLGERLAETDDELQQEAAAMQSELYNLLLCDRTDNNCCISMGLCTWMPNAPPHGSDDTFL
jgi:hypothetical protein